MAIHVGQKAQVTKCFTAQDLNDFARLSLDFNPIHLDPEYAAKTQFGKQIVHGMLVSSLFSGLLGQHLPGEGTIYLSQTLTFKKPVFIEQDITASVEVVEIREDKPIITLRALCTDANQKELVSGESIVLYKPAQTSASVLPDEHIEIKA